MSRRRVLVVLAAALGLLIEVAAERERVRISVSDDGPGVPVELAGRLFEPFATGRSGGTGLGLAAARRIAERHGGALVLESAPGARGARFSIYLPQGPVATTTPR